MATICPILSIGKDEFVECLEKKCEFYIPPVGLKTDGNCSIRSLAEAIPVLGKTLGDKLDRINVKV